MLEVKHLIREALSLESIYYMSRPAKANTASNRSSTVSSKPEGQTQQHPRSLYYVTKGKLK